MRDEETLTSDLAHIRLTSERAEARQQQILEALERLVELNMKMWDHHLRFCGQLTEKLACAEKEALDLRSEVLDELETVRESIQAILVSRHASMTELGTGRGPRRPTGS